jgi:hypothetical protein
MLIEKRLESLAERMGLTVFKVEQSLNLANVETDFLQPATLPIFMVAMPTTCQMDIGQNFIYDVWSVKVRFLFHQNQLFDILETARNYARSFIWQWNIESNGFDENITRASETIELNFSDANLSGIELNFQIKLRSSFERCPCKSNNLCAD